jgi:hypothetical protein
LPVAVAVEVVLPVAVAVEVLEPQHLKHYLLLLIIK